MIWLSILGIFFSCEQSISEESTNTDIDLRQRVRIHQLHTEAFSQSFTLEAKIEAAKYAVLAPKSAGRVAQVHVRIGDRVEEGTILLEVEDNDYLEGYREAKANHALVSIQLAHAKKQQERFLTLQAEGAVTTAQLEEVQMGVELAQGQLQRARAGLNIANSRLEGCKIQAPFGGAIIARNIEAGEMIGGPTQRPPLMIADLQQLRVIAEVDEKHAQHLNIGDHVTVHRGTDEIKTTITRINGAVDPIVHTVRIEAEIENPDLKIRHGEAAKLKLQTSSTSAVSLPRIALLDARSGEARVFVLSTENRVEERNIRYGRSSRNHVPVWEGIEEGEQILISGHTRLADGDSVLVVEN